MKITERDIQQRWSRDPRKYYEEKRKFIEQHMEDGRAHMITDLDGNLVAATYYFAPYQVYKEHLQLLNDIRIACEQDDLEHEKKQTSEEK